MTTAQEVLDTVKANAETKWGEWRRFVAAHPLTATWIMFGVGIIVGRISMLIVRWPF